MPLENLIPVINKLQGVFNIISADIKIDLPQIVVVGSQSSGKSSVLESIVGRDFLPRGSGIVTRRPLVLQLYNVPPDANGKDIEWAEFHHRQGRRITDFNQVRAEIEHDTDRVSGANKGISNEPIFLSVYSSRVVNLTLVDLPGIAKNPVGDQPKDIENRIKTMVLSYIKKPNAIILGVTAANTDLATSDAIQMARVVDPEGKRTVGVLTKIDLMDRGTDVVDIVCGKQHPLHHGWIGVVNRSQKDINEGKTVAIALKEEAAFFESSQTYAPLATRMGSLFLARQLNKLLIHHIKNTLPDLRARVTSSIHSTMKDLEALGAAPGSKTQRSGTLLKLIQAYATAYCGVIEGKSSASCKDELYGGARISHIFNDKLPTLINNLKLGEMSDQELITTVRNSAGTSGSLFPSEVAFEVFVHRDLEKLHTPCQETLAMVRTELLRIARSVPSTELRRYPALGGAVVDAASALLNKLYGPAKLFIEETINCELSYINTNHPDFVGVSGALSNSLSKAQQVASQKEDDMFKSRKKGSKSVDALPPRPKERGMPEHLTVTGAPSSGEQLAIDMIPQLVKSYHDIEQVKVQDSVPKCIMHFLVNKSKTQMQQELTMALYRDDKVEELMVEDPYVAKKRSEATLRKKLLDQAMSILNEVGEM